MKFIKYLAVFLIMLIPLKVVNAKVLKVEDIIKEYKNTSVYKEIYDSNFKIKGDKLVFVVEDEELVSLNYYDDYIEYINPYSTYDEQNMESIFAFAIAFSGIMESIFNLSGYENKTLDANYDETDLTDNFDIYGIEFKLEEIESEEVSGSFIKSLKVSLDTDKIDNLVSKYGTLRYGYTEKYKDSIPNVKISKIENNSITVKAIVNYAESDEDIPYCVIYRSDEMNGKYEEISDIYLPCNEENTITDSNLESGKTYYYKAKVLGGNKFSEVAYATTLLEPLNIDEDNNIESNTTTEINNDDNNDDNNIENSNSYNDKIYGTTENQKTGIFEIALYGILISILSFGLMLFIKKKNYFKRSL